MVSLWTAGLHEFFNLCDILTAALITFDPSPDSYFVLQLDHCKSLQASSSVFADKQRFHALLKKEKSGSKKSQ